MAKQIELTEKDIAELRRLRRCLNSGLISISLIESFTGRLQSLVDNTASSAKPPTPTVTRKEKYRKRLRVA